MKTKGHICFENTAVRGWEENLPLQGDRDEQVKTATDSELNILNKGKEMPHARQLGRTKLENGPLSLDRRCHWEVYEESEKEKECKN
jgi:hypothetical protein